MSGVVSSGPHRDFGEPVGASLLAKGPELTTPDIS